MVAYVELPRAVAAPAAFVADCCGDDADLITTTVFSTSSSSFKSRHREKYNLGQRSLGPESRGR